MGATLAKACKFFLRKEDRVGDMGRFPDSCKRQLSLNIKETSVSVIQNACFNTIIFVPLITL